MSQRSIVEIGHNNPPNITVAASDIVAILNDFMKDHPVVETEEQARAAKLLIDRGRLCHKDIEAERMTKVGPLNEQIKQINDFYRGPRNFLIRVLNEIESRVSAFMREEEANRKKIADEAKIKAAEAEKIAREAEEKERDAIESAQFGEIDVDIGGAIQVADTAFADYEKLQREADLAKRNAKVKIGGGFTRALGLRTRETVLIDNAVEVLWVIGVTDDVREALIKGARAYKRLHNRWPPGVRVETERTV